MVFKCVTCDKAFTAKKNLNRHLQLCGATEKKPLACASCGKYFTRKDSLQRHAQSCPIRKQNLNLPPTTGFECDHCKRRFTARRNLVNHQCEAIEKKLFACEGCRKSFMRTDNLQRHAQSCSMCTQNLDTFPTPAADSALSDLSPTPTKKAKLMVRCEMCDVDVANYRAHARSTEHKNNLCSPLSDNIEIIQSAFKSRIATYRVHNPNNIIMPEDFMDSVRDSVLGLIGNHTTGDTIKMNLELFVTYTITKGEIITEDIKSFNTRNVTVSASSDLGELYEKYTSTIKTKSEEFQERDSGWTLKGVLHLEVNINKYTPLHGSSYLPLSPKIQVKKAVVNIKNHDNACFAWAVVSALHPVDKHTDRVTSYPHYSTVLNLDNITFPISTYDIRLFEKQNDISVNIYEVEKDKVVGPLYFTSKKRGTHVNLLYLEEGDKGHYCWIKNLSRLCGASLSKRAHKKWFCDGCIQYFSSEDRLNRHTLNECTHVSSSVPSEGENISRFQNHNYQLDVPFVVYADFEAILTPIHTCAPDPKKTHTHFVHEHTPFSFAYYIHCKHDENLCKFVTYRGTNCAKKFMEKLTADLEHVSNTLATVIPMTPLTEEENRDFFTAIACHICGGALSIDRVRDHCHLTGKYRGPAHYNCNLNYKLNPIVPIVFHNLSNYDAHFIIQTFGESDEKIELLPKNKENYISITKYVTYNESKRTLKLRFIDSLRFLASGLDKLAANLTPEQCEISRKFASSQADFQLLLRKGIFPYEFLDSWEKLTTTQLPTREEFYSSLTGTTISDDDYSHAQNVWRHFNISDLGEYSDLYLKTDVLLLADVFENFRRVCVGTYKLDPAHYYTAPSLSWDAMLKHTKIELELLTDFEMIHFIKNGIRGGLSQCSGRYAKANNKYLPDYDPEKDEICIAYHDANNQYGWAMSCSLPSGGFRWLSAEEIETLDIIHHSSDSNIGYFLEVDLQYPTSLHSYHNELPFCPERMLTPLNVKQKNVKLMATLHDKERYIIHYVNLQQAIQHGLILKKIHRVIEFTQSHWLESYINMNNALRTNSKNNFEKDFYKLMNNSVFGKTMENVEKRVDVRLITQWESRGRRLGAQALIARPNFHSRSIIHENLAIIEMKRTKIVYDKPIYVGFTVLELSKTLMYNFNYGLIKPLFMERSKLLYTDTDSFIYEIKGDFYESLKLSDLEKYFDTSDMPTDNVYGIPRLNKKVLGKFKDEGAGKIFNEFVGIRSKCYFVGISGEDDIKKIKGIKRNVVKNDIFKDDFVNCINNNPNTLHKPMTLIRSNKHDVKTQLVNKVALRNYDDKRFIIPNSHDTLAWGHKDIDNKYYFI